MSGSKNYEYGISHRPSLTVSQDHKTHESINIVHYIHVYIYLQNVTLLELMDEDDVVQECKSQNKKLIDL